MIITTIMMMMITITMITVIIIALKGAIRDFYNLLTAPRTVSSRGQGAMACKSLATHRALIACSMSCATCKKSSNRIYFSFILLAELLTDEGGEETGDTRETPYELQKCYILKSENSAPNETRTLHSSIGGRLGRQTC